MRARLLEATVELLVEKGYAGTSTTLVSERAGVSRGAQLHHFPTKQDLVVAAVQHVTEVRGAELAAAAEELPTGPEADPRGAPGARRPLHLAGLHRRARALGGGPHRPGPAGRGRAAGAEGRPRDAPDDRRSPRRRRVAARRARARAGHARPGPRARAGQHDQRRPAPAYPDPRPVGARPSTTRWSADDRPAGRDCSTTSPPRATSSARPSTDSAPDGWTRPTPAPGWTVATQVAHLLWTDEVAVLAAHSHESPEAKQAWDDVVLAAINDPMGYVDEGAFELAALPRDEVLDALGRGPGRRSATPSPRCRPARRCRGSARRCRPPRWRPRGSWRPGRTRSTSTTPLESGPSPTDRIRHVAHLGVRTRNYSYSVHQEEPPAEEFRVELTAPERRGLDVGSRGRGPVGARAGVRLLPAGHPAGQPRRHRPGRGRCRRRALARHRAGVRRARRAPGGRSTA